MRLDVTEKLLNLKKLCLNLLFRGFVNKANQRFFSNGFVFPNLNAKIELILDDFVRPFVMDMAMELKMRRGWICRDMDQFYSMTPYFQESRLQDDIKSDTSHPACISVMVSTNADFIAMKLRANGMEMVDIAESKIPKKENLVIYTNRSIPIINEVDIHLFDGGVGTRSISDDISV